jgi:hypothetical protein
MIREANEAGSVWSIKGPYNARRLTLESKDCSVLIRYSLRNYLFVPCFSPSYSSLACILYLITSQYRHSFYIDKFSFILLHLFVLSHFGFFVPTFHIAHIHCINAPFLACILIRTLHLKLYCLNSRTVSIIRYNLTAGARKHKSLLRVL